MKRYLMPIVVLAVLCMVILWFPGIAEKMDTDHEAIEKRAVVAADARVAELVSNDVQLPATGEVLYNEGDIPGGYMVTYKGKMHNLPLTVYFEYDPSKDMVALQSSEVVFTLKKGCDILKEEKALSGLVTDEDEISHDEMKPFFDVFTTYLRSVGLDPNDYCWHLDAIYTDGTAVLIEGYGKSGCVLSELSKNQKKQWILKLNWNDSADESYSEIYSDVQPGDFIAGYAECFDRNTIALSDMLIA